MKRIAIVILPVIIFSSCGNKEPTHWGISDADYNAMKSDYIQILDYTITAFENHELIVSRHMDFYDSVVAKINDCNYEEEKPKAIILDYYNKIVDIAEYEADYIQNECSYSTYVHNVTDSLTKINYIFEVDENDNRN